jgi:branched-chain amino acid transport system substrate-binding protein
MIHKSTRLRPAPTLLLLGAVTIAMTACGSNAKSTSTTSPAAAATTSAAATTAGSAAPTTSGSTAASTSGSTAATTAGTTDAASGGTARTGQTIKVGYVNNEGGAISLPEFRTGGQVAIDAINNSGGINGAKIEVVSCSADSSPESAINCANKLIEANVVLAYTGIDVASDAAVPLYAKAGIPYITSNGWGPAQEKDPNSFILHAASGAYFATPLGVFKKAGITTVGVLFENSAAGKAYEPTVKSYVEKLGLKEVEVFVDPTNPDWTAALATAKSGGASAVWGQLTEPGCIGLTNAAAAVQFTGIVFAGSCSVYMSVTGDKAVGTYNQSDIYFPDTRAAAPPAIQQRIDEYVAAMTAAGHTDQINGFAAAPYSAWYELRSALEAIDPGTAITADSIKAELSSGKTIPGWLGPDLHCGAEPWPDSPSACSDQIAVWKVVKNSDGTLGRDLVQDFSSAYDLVK